MTHTFSDTNTRNPIQSRLVDACQTLDPDQARRAIEEGADPNGSTSQDCPLSIAVLAAKSERSDHLQQREVLIRLLFKSGAKPDPEWAQSGDLATSPGIEILLEASLDRIEGKIWDEDGEIAVLEAWLESGNRPDQEAGIDGRRRGIIWALAFSINEMSEWGMAENPSLQDRVWSFARRAIITLGLHGLPLTQDRLRIDGLDETQIEPTLEGFRIEQARRAQWQMEASTPMAGGKQRGPGRL